jgi:nucleotide-binding universal stress UspA family protein
MRYIVGYAPNDRGKDAIALATALAQTQDAGFQIVHTLDGPAPADAESDPERAVQELRTGHADEWLNEAVASVPGDVTVTKRLVYAHSSAEGLLDAAHESDAVLIIVGAARRGPLKRFTIGSVANALLHISDVTIALAPSGYQRPQRITRMTAAIGSRQGADLLLDVAVEAAARRHVPLRLLSLVGLDQEETQGDDRVIEAARAHAAGVLDEALARVGTRTDVTATVAEGSTIEEAVASVPWDDAEIALIGSSRLAEHRKIFMGTTANKILHALPIPLVVVPRISGDDSSASRGPVL